MAAQGAGLLMHLTREQGMTNPTPQQRITRLTEVLREMDSTQQEADENGDREVAWYYYRDQVEDAMGLDRGALDTGDRVSLDDVFASVREQVEAQGGTWPPKAPPGLRIHPTHFTGVLAVLHATTSDRRRLDEPAPELTRQLPLPFVRPGEGAIGRIDRVWRDGDLIRYSGQLNDSHPDAEETRADIETGRLVGALDVDSITEDGMKFLHQGRILSKEEVAALPTDADDFEMVLLSGWRATAVTLMSAEGKAWPEVSLTLESGEEENA